MAQAIDQGVTDHARAYVARNFTGREVSNGVLAITLFALCALAIACTAARLDPAQAIYSAGLTCGAAGVVMTIGWGNSSGNGDVCLCTSAEIERRGKVIDARVEGFTLELRGINARLDGLEGISREIAEAVQYVMRDQLAERRRQI